MATRSATKTTDRPKMPKKRPTLNLSVVAVLDHDFEKYQDGSLRMTMDHCEMSRDGKKLGYVAAALPAGVVVSIGERSYFVSPQALWEAVEQAEATQPQPPAVKE